MALAAALARAGGGALHACMHVSWLVRCAACMHACMRRGIDRSRRVGAAAENGERGLLTLYVLHFPCSCHDVPIACDAQGAASNVAMLGIWVGLAISVVVACNG